MIEFDYWTIPLLILAFFTWIRLYFYHPKYHHIKGRVKPGFEAVEEAFRKNFEKNWESEGAAFAVFYDAEIVVDLWGGYANSKLEKLWAADTITVAFSTTKAACSLCLALLVDRGLLSYDDLVTKYWPEFGQNGKDDVTVRMLVSHQAGLAVLDEQITYEMIRDWRHMSRALEGQKPNWPLAKNRAGYHAITHGFLIDQLVRRVDPQHRSIGNFFREELAERHGIDFHIGLPIENENRVAHIRVPSLHQLFLDLTDPKFLYAIFRMFMNPYHGLLKKSMKNPMWLEIDQKGNCAFNDPELHGLEVASAVGIGSARALAKLMDLLNCCDPPLLSDETIATISRPIFEDERDVVLGINTSHGHGFMHDKNPEGNFVFGHPGYGGQNVRVDLHHGLSMAYLHNGLTSDTGHFSWTFKNLEKVVYQCIK